MDIDSYIAQSIEHFKDKADHNKFEALWSFRIVILSSVTTPLLISLNDDNLWGKVVPAILSTIVAIGTAWIQKRQPHQLWKLYRSSQRRIENESALYKYNVGQYSNGQEKDKTIVRKIVDIRNETHRVWEGLVPTHEDNKETNQ